MPQIIVIMLIVFTVLFHFGLSVGYKRLDCREFTRQNLISKVREELDNSGIVIVDNIILNEKDFVQLTEEFGEALDLPDILGKVIQSLFKTINDKLN